MEVTKVSTGDSTAKLNIEIVESDYAQKYQSELKKLAREASIPGFRPGKVPVGMMKKRFGTSVMVDVINQLVSEGLTNYIAENKLSLIGEPIPAEEQKQVDFENQKEFEFAFDIGFMPEIDLNIDENIKADYYKVKAIDEQIDSFLDEKRLELGPMESVEEVQKGDKVEFEIRALDQDGDPVKGAEKKEGAFFTSEITDEDALTSIIGAKPEDELTIDPVKCFGSQDKAVELTGFDKATIEQNTTGFQLKIKYIERKVPAEMNEEFYEQLFPGGEFKEEQQVRDEIARQIEMAQAFESDRFFLMDVMDRLYKETDIPLPDDFMKRWLYFSNKGEASMEDIEKDYDGIRRQLVTSLIENKLQSEHEELIVTEEDLKADMEQKLIGYFGQNASLPGGDFTEFAKTYAERWIKDEKNKDEVNKIQKEIFDARLTKLLKSKVTLVEKEVTPQEFYTAFNERFKTNIPVTDESHPPKPEEEGNKTQESDSGATDESKDVQKDEQ
jgi:trigger factor